MSSRSADGRQFGIKCSASAFYTSITVRVRISDSEDYQNKNLDSLLFDYVILIWKAAELPFIRKGNITTSLRELFSCEPHGKVIAVSSLTHVTVLRGNGGYHEVMSHVWL